MNRHTDWTSEPVTWRGYLKLCGIFALIGTAISVIANVILMKPAWWKATKDFVRRLFRK